MSKGKPDDKLTELSGEVVAAVRAQVQHMAERGLIDPDKMRLTIEARREEVKRLVDGGMSQRETAAILGVRQATVGRDLNRNGSRDPVNAKQNVPPVNHNGSPTDRDERREAAHAANDALAKVEVIAPTAIYETIVVDPPWPMVKIERDVRPNQVGFDYPTMSLEELSNFSSTLNKMAADNCHLFMWTTQKHLPTALNLVDHYGFHYVLAMVWHKAGGYQPTGLPQYNCEFIVYARKGTPKFVTTQGFFCCLNGARREHSRKPDEFYDMIRLVTRGPRIDIFSREPRDGFDQYGNETTKFEAAE